MKTNLIIFDKLGEFYEDGYYLELKKEFDSHIKTADKLDVFFLIKEIKATNNGMEWLTQLIQKRCTIPDNLIKVINNGDLIRSSCFIPNNGDDAISLQVCAFLNGCSLSFGLVKKVWSTKSELTLLLTVCQEDFEFDLITTIT